MNIKLFAQKYNLTQSTIRYYIQQELLVPKIQNTRYHFDAQCESDIIDICTLKDIGVSIKDIKSFLAQKRIGTFGGDINVEKILTMLQQHKQTLELEEKAIKAKIDNLNIYYEKIINNKPSNFAVKPKISGLKIQFVSNLYCPMCHKMLKLQTHIIENGEILQGSFFCDCRYHGEIKNGILIIPNFYQTQSEIYHAHWWHKKLTDAEINSIYKIYKWIFYHLAELPTDNQVILENFINNYFFLFHNANNLNPKAIYIMADESLEVVQHYKEKFDTLYPDLNILFIAGDSVVLPIKSHTIDYYIDSFKSSSFTFCQKGFLPELLKNYFHNRSQLIGSFTTLSNSKNESTWLKQYNLNTIKNLLNNMGFSITESYLDDPLYSSSLIIQEQEDILRHFTIKANFQE